MRAAIAVLAMAVVGLLPARSAYVRPAAAAAPGMNVVEIVLDDTSPQDIRRMRFLRSLGQWVEFRNHFDHISTCCPGRVDLLSGEYSHRDGVEDNGGSDGPANFRDATALPVAMRNAGYHTILDGKYLNGYGVDFRVNQKPPGWDRFMAFRGAARYYDYTMLDQGVWPVTYGGPADPGNYSTTVIRDRFVQDLRSAPAGRPVFAVAAPFATHGPWDTRGTVYAGRYATADVPRTPAFNEPDVLDKPDFVQALPPVDADRLAVLQRRAWATADSVDDLLQETVRVLRDTGRWSRTVLIVVADNGYSWGDHRWQYKKCEYASCMRIPLLIRYPGATGRRVTGLSQQVDVARTIADIGNATPLRRQDGVSLLPTVTSGAPTGRGYVLERWGGGGALSPSNPEGFSAYRTSDSLYVRLSSGERELYDERADPFELSNVAGQPRYAAREAQLDRALHEATRGLPAPAHGSRGTADDDED